MARDVDLIVIHCSASPNGVSLFEGETGAPGFCTPVEVIDRWHAKRGFERNPNWVRTMNPTLKHIGYHYVVYTNGGIATGRHTDEIGAHVYGFNRRSVGVCMVGTDAFTRPQWASLAKLIEALRLKYPRARVTGHRDLSPDVDGDGIVEKWEWLKTCPGFDVARWLSLHAPQLENVLDNPPKEALE